MLNYIFRKDWATAFVNYLVGETEGVNIVHQQGGYGRTSWKRCREPRRDSKIQSKLSTALDTKRLNIEDIDDKLPLDYLYNFSFYATKDAKTTKFMPTMMMCSQAITNKCNVSTISVNNVKRSSQLKGITNEWLLSRLKVYQISKETLMTKFQEVIEKQPFGKKPNVDPKALFYPTGMSTPSWSKFVTFLLLRQEKASKLLKTRRSELRLSSMEEVIPDDDGNPRANQLGLSIKMV